MDGALVTVIIISAAVAFFIFRAWRQRPIKPVGSADVKLSSSPPAPVAPANREPSPPPPLPVPEEDRLAQEAAEMNAHWDEERRAVERTHYDEMQPIKEKLAKARQLVDKSGVGDAARDILRIMWHWPSWSKRDDWKMPVPVEGLDGGRTPRHKHGGREGSWLSWTFDGEQYQLELTINPNYTGDAADIGDLKLTVGGEPVMHLDVSQRLGDEYDSWGVFGVSAFKAGPWMVRLNDLAGRLRIADRQGLRDHEKLFYGEKAGKIELE